MAGDTRCRRVFLEFAMKMFPDMGSMIKGYPCTPLVRIARKRRVTVRQTREYFRMTGLALWPVHRSQIEIFPSMLSVTRCARQWLSFRWHHARHPRCNFQEKRHVSDPRRPDQTFRDGSQFFRWTTVRLECPFPKIMTPQTQLAGLLSRSRCTQHRNPARKASMRGRMTVRTRSGRGAMSNREFSGREEGRFLQAREKEKREANRDHGEPKRHPASHGQETGNRLAPGNGMVTDSVR